MRPRCSAFALALALAVCSCTTSQSRPVTAPSRDSLQEFLERSAAAAAIAEAARAEGLLATADSHIEDLEIVAAALGIERIAQLEQHVDAVTGSAALLFAALDERRRGSRTGDAAHWVAVALLALDEDTPADQTLRADLDWQVDYLDDVLALRRLNTQGRLADAVLGAVEREPEPYRMMIVPPIDADNRPGFHAREQTGYFPVFDAAGSRTIVATISLERGERLDWDELRILVRRPGSARVITAPQQPVRRFTLQEDGTMLASGTTELAAGQQFDLLAQIPGTSTLALLAPDTIAVLPWEVACCQVLQRPEVDWWARLTTDYPGTWALASTETFTHGFPARAAANRAARANRPPPMRLGPLGEAGTVDVYGGQRLAYWLRGTPGARPLLVLHGGPGIGSEYLRRPLTEQLGDGHLLYLYDQRGSGYSEGGIPDLLTIGRAVLDADAMRRAAEVERIDILGHSYGGLLALHYALHYPYRVDRLVLVDPDPATRAAWETFRERVAARTRPEDAARIAELTAQPGWDEEPQTAGAVFRLRMNAYLADPAARLRIEVPFNELTIANFRTTPPLVRDSLGDWDLGDRLRRIEAPTLIVAGGDSVFPLSAMHYLAGTIPDARLEVIDGVGHFPFLEAPEAFAAAVREFLRR